MKGHRELFAIFLCNVKYWSGLDEVLVLVGAVLTAKLTDVCCFFYPKFLNLLSLKSVC